jgi:hypothetical protein
MITMPPRRAQQPGSRPVRRKLDLFDGGEDMFDGLFDGEESKHDPEHEPVPDLDNRFERHAGDMESENSDASDMESKKDDIDNIESRNDEAGSTGNSDETHEPIAHPNTDSNERESDIDEDRQQHTWIVNVGMKNDSRFSGNKLVDMILRGEKKAKYLPPNISCCNQWLALRQIHCDNAMDNGKIRCAIKLSAVIRRGPEWEKEEWGWDSTQNRQAYEIIDIRLFRTCLTTTFSNQGKPFRVSTADEYLQETADLLLAIQSGARPDKSKIVKNRTINFLQARERRRKQRIEQFLNRQYFQIKKKGLIKLMCCKKKMCMHSYRCGYVAYHEEAIQLFHWLVTTFQAMSQEKQRMFMRERMTVKNSAFNDRKTQYWLEPYADLVRYRELGHLPIYPTSDHTAMIPICRNFFQWTFGISHNKIDQPTILGRDLGFAVELQPRASRRQIWDAGASDCIVSWLLSFAAFHMYDPTQDMIVLAVGTHKQVYENYQADAEISSEGRFFPRRPTGEAYIPSLSFFLKVWRTHPALKHIKIRKYLPHALCSTCVHYRDCRQEKLTKEEKKKLFDEERKHYAYVRQERNSYYNRRKQGIFCQNDFLSIILDGADQAAYALPHFVDKDKDTEKCIKNPLYIMGGLVHGHRAYAFSYLKNVKHGSNITIECLHRILTDMKQSGKPIPKTIYLQLDNTTKQNKNRYLIAYAACLVEWGVTDRVIISFLPVGHTHEDIGMYIFFGGFFCLCLFGLFVEKTIFIEFSH